MKTKNILLSILVIILVVVLEMLVMGYYKKTIETDKNPIVVMEIENYGTVAMELYPDKAPNTVANFIKLINEGYYNGLTFHRTIPDTLIQGGDKEGTGSGQTSYTIPGEFYANGYEGNDIRHEAGVLSMARADYSSLSSSLTSESYNSAGSQFFILTDTVRNFDGLYAGFGKVILGLDIIEKISKLETVVETNEETGEKTDTNKPKNPPVIKNMVVETFGINYGDPETLEPFDYYTWMLSQYQYDESSVLIPEE